MLCPYTKADDQIEECGYTYCEIERNQTFEYEISSLADDENTVYREGLFYDD